MEEFGAFIVIITLVAIIAGVGFIVGWERSNYYHHQLCGERLSHAQTAKDSLAIYTDDKFCLKKVET